MLKRCTVKAILVPGRTKCARVAACLVCLEFCLLTSFTTHSLLLIEHAHLNEVHVIIIQHLETVLHYFIFFFLVLYFTLSWL